MKTWLAVMMAVSLGAEAKSLQLAPFEGKGAAKVRKAVAGKLCRHLLCVDEEDGDTVLHGKVVKKGGKSLLEIELRDSDGGLVLSQRVPLQGTGYAKKVDRVVRDALAPAKADKEKEDEEEDTAEEPEAPATSSLSPVGERDRVRGSAPVEAEPSGARQDARDGAVAAAPSAGNEVATRLEEPESPAARRFLWLSAGGQVQSRRLAYQGLATPELAGKNDLALMPRVDLALFPFAREGMSGLGLVGYFASTVTSTPTEVKGRELDAALAWDLKLTPWLTLEPAAGFHWQKLDGSGAATEYRAVRAGAGARLTFGRLQLHGRASYLAVIGGAGELTQKYFPHGRTGAAFATELGVAVSVVGRLELTLNGTYDVYLHALNSEPGDLYVARSAVDSYLGGAVGLRFSF